MSNLIFSSHDEVRQFLLQNDNCSFTLLSDCNHEPYLRIKSYLKVGNAWRHREVNWLLTEKSIESNKVQEIFISDRSDDESDFHKGEKWV
jgi:hypothetical protein